MFLLEYLFFFFFKQKTAYEMRISDWSSDVCSSDLTWSGACSRTAPTPASSTESPTRTWPSTTWSVTRSRPWTRSTPFRIPASPCRARSTVRRATTETIPWARSEEHTSELQSLMRISYDVFCLKKKRYKKNVIKTKPRAHNTKLTTLIVKQQQGR